MQFSNGEDNIFPKKKIKRKIRINHSRSPLKLLKNKIKYKQEKTVNAEETLENLDEVIQRVQSIIDQDEREEKRDKLLKMVYDDDISAEDVHSTIDITHVELELIVNELVELGFLRFINEDEVELTNDGILYLQNQD